MKITCSLAILCAIVFSCGRNSDPAIKQLEKNYAAFEKARYNFPGGEAYFVLSSNDANTVFDTICAVNNRFIEKNSGRTELNQHVKTWVIQQLFIQPGKGGNFAIDSVDQEKQELNYLFDHILPRILKSNAFTVHRKGEYTDKKLGITYEIYPCNLREVRNNGMFRIITSGRFNPEYYFYGRGGLNKRQIVDKQYRSRKCTADIFINISSRDHLDQSISIVLKDTIDVYAIEHSTYNYLDH